MRRIDGQQRLSLLKKNPYLCACWAGKLPQTGKVHVLLVERLRDERGKLLPHAVDPSFTHGIRCFVRSEGLEQIAFHGQYDCIFDKIHPDFFAVQIAHKLSWAILRCKDSNILLGQSDRPWVECVESIFRSLREKRGLSIIDFPSLN